MFNIRCLFGHDWELIRSTPKLYIDKGMSSGQGVLNGTFIYLSFYVDMVCLRCGKVHLEIDKAIETQKQSQREKEERTKKALKLIEQCL